MTFVRDPWTTDVISPYMGTDVISPYVGMVGLGQLATDPRAILAHLHGLAVAIYDAQQRARTNPAVELQNVRNLLEQFQVVRQRFLQVSEAADPTQLGVVDRFILAVGEWIERSAQALPQAVSAIPRALVDAIGQTGWVAVKAVVPFLVIGFGLLYFVMQAERSRTVRRYVA